MIVHHHAQRRSLRRSPPRRPPLDLEHAQSTGGSRSSRSTIEPVRRRPLARAAPSLQREDQLQRRVDRQLFPGGQPTRVPVQPIQVDGSELLHEHARRFAGNLDLGAERRGSCVARRRCHVAVDRPRSSSAWTITA